MSLAQLTEKIKNDAYREAEEVLAKARSKASEIIEHANKENAAVKESFEKRFEEEMPKIFKRREIVANIDVKKRKLLSKRTLIQDVFDEALNKMKSFNKEDYLELCNSLLKKSVVTGDEEVLIGENEKFVDEAWINAYNKKNNTNLILSKEIANISGGFILKRDKIRTNCSWDMLIQVAQEKKESEVVKRLFPPKE
jgi:V/A-type H+-transporting ATPase subunit E